MGSEILDSGGWVGALPTPGPQAPLAPALELEVLPMRRVGAHSPVRVPPGRHLHLATADEPAPAAGDGAPSLDADDGYAGGYDGARSRGSIATREVSRSGDPADPDDVEDVDDWDDWDGIDSLSEDDEPRPVGLREVAAAVAASARRIATDPARRRTAVQVVAACLSLMIFTGWAVHAHDQRILATQRAGALDVDIRLAQVPADTSDGDGQLPALEGSASAEVQLHNVGPLPVHLLGLDVLAGFDHDASYPVLRTDTTVQAGDQLDQSYHVRLPCGVDRGAAAAGSMNAQIRTSDGVVHTVPVDLTTVNDSGGLLGACLYYEFRQGQFRGSSS